VITVVVAIAASLGAVSRYLLDREVQRRHASVLPVGTFVVNVSGSCLLGLVTGLGLHHGWSSDAVTVIGVGLLGGYTTWSTFTWESFALTEQGALSAAMVNVVASIVVGLAAAAAGLGLALI
jgi:CrcB protein